MGEPQSKKRKNEARHSVVVIGSGLAGLCAAIEAHTNGSKVILLEKNAFLGGNSSLASSGMNAVNSTAQKVNGIQDSTEVFLHDTLKSGGGLSSVNLVTILVNESTSALEFLSQFGVDLSVVGQCGAHALPRTHRAQEREDGKLENIGRHITSHLIQYLKSKSHEEIRIITGATVERLLVNQDHHVVGAHYVMEVEGHKSEVDVFGDAVVLATGGFGANPKIVEQFGVTKFSKFPTTNGPWASGDGIKMIQQVGGQLLQLEEVQIHPTGIVDPKNPLEKKKWLAPEAFRGCGGILLDSSGRRFVNELEQRNKVSESILAYGHKYKKLGLLANEDDLPTIVYLILNNRAAEAFGMKFFNFYKSKGLIQSFKNIEELAEYLGTSPDNIRKTFQNYKQSTFLKEDEFGKKFFPVVFDENEELHLIIVTPSIHYTMGGARISDLGEVMTCNDCPIPGLYACGEVTGGIHGKNRLGGNSLLECVVFGRRAGNNASKYIGVSSSEGISTKPGFVDSDGIFHESVLHPDRFVPLRLKDRFQLNKTSHIFRFSLPKSTDQVGLMCGQYIAVRAHLGGEEVIRYYSPISRNSDYGKIELLVKIEEDKIREGSMTHFLFHLEPGNTLDFKGPLGGFEYHRNTYREVGMIAGGTGITPMMQIIRSVAHHPEDETNIRLLYGNYYEDDILCKEELMYHCATRTNISSEIFLAHPPPKWTMGSGFIDEEAIKKYLPKPGSDIKIILCGPPPMVNSIKEILKKLEYSNEMIFSYI